MKVYMFQKVKQILSDCNYNCYTEEELFYDYEDAIKYFKEVYNLTIERIEEHCCEEGEKVFDLCEINHYSKDRCRIFMEDEFWISFEIHEKTIMNFN